MNAGRLIAVLGTLAFAAAGACTNGSGGGGEGIVLPTGAPEPGGSTYEPPGGGQEPGATVPDPAGGGYESPGGGTCLVCTTYTCQITGTLSAGFGTLTGTLGLSAQAGVNGCVVTGSDGQGQFLCGGTILDEGNDGGGGVVGSWHASGQTGLTISIAASGVTGYATCTQGGSSSSGSSSSGVPSFEDAGFELDGGI